MKTKESVKLNLRRNLDTRAILNEEWNKIAKPFDKKIEDLKAKREEALKRLRSRFDGLNKRIDKYEDEIRYWDDNVARRKWSRKVPTSPEEFKQYVEAVERRYGRSWIDPMKRVIKLPNGVIIFGVYSGDDRVYGAWQGRKKVGSLYVEPAQSVSDAMSVEGKVLRKQVKFVRVENSIGYGSTIQKPLATWKAELAKLKKA